MRLSLGCDGTVPAFNPFRNLVINLQAAGPAAVICVLFLCVTAMGILGNGPLAEKELNILAIAVGCLVVVFAGSRRPTNVRPRPARPLQYPPTYNFASWSLRPCRATSNSVPALRLGWTASAGAGALAGVPLARPSQMC